MNSIQIIIGGKELTFSVKFDNDFDAGAPWDNADGHGPVTGWVRRDKRPGELVLNSSHGDKRYYDFAEACRIALRDGWGLEERRVAEWTESAGRAPTPRQIASAAARADYEYLRGWCAQEWEYVGVIVTLLDDDGEETEVTDSLWGVETFGDHHHEQARIMADELAGGYGVSWGEVKKESFGYWQAAKVTA